MAKAKVSLKGDPKTPEFLTTKSEMRKEKDQLNKSKKALDEIDLSASWSMTVSLFFWSNFKIEQFI